MNYPKVSIIILNWNGLKDTLECLESLKKVTYPNYKVIVVDNASEGNDVQVLKEKFGEYIRIIQNDKNYGLGKGFNIGVRYALENSDAKYIMMMNNDVVVAPDFLDELMKVAEGDEQIGIVVPKVYYYDYNGRKDIIWHAGGKTRWWSLRLCVDIGRGDYDSPKYQTLASVDWFEGAVMMWKRSVTEKAGFLSEWYFFGAEGIEFSHKASKKHGFKNMYVPTAKAWHKVAASTKRADISRHPNLSVLYHFIKEVFPVYVYIYQLLILPAKLFRWAVLYLVKYRNMYSLRCFLSDFARFTLRKHKQSL